MTELAKLILSAPTLNVALLCVLAALGLIYHKERKRNRAGVSVHAPSENKRLEAHYARGHQLANDMGIVTLRVDRLERDVGSMKAQVDTLIPEFAAVKATVESLKGTVDDVKDGQDKLAEKIDRMLERLLRD